MRTHAAVLLLVTFLAGSLLPIRVAGDTWEEQRDRLKALIDKQVEAEVTRRVNPRSIAKALSIEEWPVPESTLTIEEVEEHAEVLGRKKAMEQFPESMEEEINTAAEEKYRMYEIGDKVEFVIRKGLGTNPKVKGTFLGANPQKVKVGHRRILRQDMEEEDLAHFYKDLHEELKNRYIAARLRVLDAQRDSFEEDYTKKYRSELYKKAHYVNYKRRWVPKRKLLDMATEYMKNKERKKIRPTIEEQTYTENGYVRKEGSWVPRSVADALEAKLKKLLASKEEEDARREEERARDGDDDDGGGDGMDDDYMDEEGGGDEDGYDEEEGMTPDQEDMYGEDEGI